jgi:fatty acid-binding protein DegV
MGKEVAILTDSTASISEPILVENLRQIVESKVDVVESFVGELSPALAVHSGPGTAGICFLPAEL